MNKLLPKDLQDKRWALMGQKAEIEKQIKELDEQIKERRRTCKHTRPAGLTEYTVYCAKCGEVIGGRWAQRNWL